MDEHTDGNPVQQEGNNWKHYFTTVTSLSKYLALALLVVLPFAGFWVGTQYEQHQVNSSDSLEESQQVNPDTSSQDWQHGAYFGLFYEYPSSQKRIFADNAFETRVIHSSIEGEESELGLVIYHPYHICTVSQRQECFKEEVKILAEDKVLTNGDESKELLEYKLAEYNAKTSYEARVLDIPSYGPVAAFVSEEGDAVIPLLIPTVNGLESYIELRLRNLESDPTKRFIRSLHFLDDHWTLKKKE